MANALLRALHDVPELLLGPQLIEKRLLQNPMQNLEHDRLLVIASLTMCEQHTTTIIRIFLLSIHVRLLVDGACFQFDAQGIKKLVFGQSLEIQ